MGQKNAMEFMKIRRYVIDLIATGGDRPQQLPSSRKLGEMFGVSHPTALRAIKDLTEEGILMPCKGGGSITCKKLVGQTGKFKIFGIVTHLGKQAFDVHYFIRITSAITEELTRRNFLYCTQNLYLEVPSALESVVAESSLTGLILIDARNGLIESAEKLNAKGLPVISFMNRVGNISSGSQNWEEENYAVACVLFRERRERVLVVSEPGDIYIEAIRKGVFRACSEFHLSEDKIIVLEDEEENNCKRIREILAFGMKFDAVIFPRYYPSAYEIILEKTDVVTECRLVTNEFALFDEMAFSGYVIRYNLKKAAVMLVDNLLAQMKNGTAEVSKADLEITLELYKNGQCRPAE